MRATRLNITLVTLRALRQEIASLGKDELAKWILRETSRGNILLPYTRGKKLVSPLETFLHMRLRPKYEG